MPNALLNAETIETYRELQSPEDPNFLRDFLTVFLNALPGQLEAVKAAISSGNPAALAASAHALKSSCGNLGVIPMVELCAKLERLGKSGSTAGADLDLASLLQNAEGLKLEIFALPEFAMTKSA